MKRKFLKNEIEEVFRAAYARQGMSYKHIEYDCNEHRTEQRYP